MRRSGYENELRSMTSSAKGPGEHADAHRGLELAGEIAQGGRRRGPSGRDGRRSRRKTMQGLPCFWSPWVDSWRSCEGPTGLGRSGDHRRRGIARAGHLTGGGSRSNSGHGRG
jgi:hypothetical protein